MQPDTHIVVFDGICNLCSGVVDFVSARGPRGVFTFVPMQTPQGQQLLEAHGVSIDQVDTFLLIRGGGDSGGGGGSGSGGGDGGGGDGGKGEALVRSDAAIAIAAELRRPWNLLTGLRLVPRSIRDRVYSLVARNRYRWFGKRATCKFYA